MGYTGRVCGRVAPNVVGEVVVNIRGGTETFYAYPAEKDRVIDVGTAVLVVEYQPPRTVLVEPWVEDITDL